MDCGNLFIIVVNTINNRFRIDLSYLRHFEINCVDSFDGGSFAGTFMLTYVSFRFDLELRLTFVCIVDGTTDS